VTPAVAGAAGARARPVRARAIGLTAQGFALLGTAVGLFTIAVGVGPRTAPDLAYHAAIVSVLVAGLVAVARRRPDALRSTGAPRRRAPA
jgi:hypothetical protein